MKVPQSRGMRLAGPRLVLAGTALAALALTACGSSSL